MCHEPDSFPPIPVISGAAVAHEDLVLESPDGNRFAAFAALPEEPSNAGVVDPARTSAGSTASTRSWRCGSPSAGTQRSRSTTSAAPPAAAKRDDDFEYMPHVQQTTQEGVQADIAAAVELAARPRRVRRCSRSASASADGTRGWRRRPVTAWPAPSASTAGPAGAGRDAGPDPARRRMRRRSSRCRAAPTGHHGRRRRRVRRSARRPPASSTRSSRTKAPRTASSTGSEDFAEASADAWERVLTFIR